MATFEEALKCMREGKKVTRKHYTCCFSMVSSVIYVTYQYNTNKKISEIKEHFWLDEIMAEDWEVVEDDNK